MRTKCMQFLSVASLAFLLSMSQLLAGNITYAVNPTDGGITVPAGTVAYNVGDEVAVTATANPGFKFVEWSTSSTSIAVLNKGKKNTTMKIFATDNATLTANFTVADTSTLTLVPSPAGGGQPTFVPDFTVVMGAWGNATAYLSGQYVRPTLYNGHYYKCTQSGISMTIEPTWPTNGSSVSDTNGSSIWVTNKVYTLDNLVTPITINGHYYICTTAGTSNPAVEPTWNTSGGTTNDGTVVWTDMGAIVTWQDVGMSVTYDLGSTAWINPGTKSGYKFIGWSLTSGTGAINQVAQSVELNSSAVVVQANYEAIPDPGTAILTITASPTAALGTVWTPNEDYLWNNIVYPTAAKANGHYYRCSTWPSGTSAATEPVTWPTDGTTVIDGGVTWSDIGYQPTTAKEAWGQIIDRTDNTVYSVGDFVKVVGSGPFPAHYYRCQVAGQSSSAPPAVWPTDGSTVTDTTNITTWAVSTAYVAGALVQPITANGHYYICLSNGNSGGTAPTWKTDGTNTTDGTTSWGDRGTIITWRDVGRNPFNVGETVTLWEQHDLDYDFSAWTLGASSGKAKLAGNQLTFLEPTVAVIANYVVQGTPVPATVKLSVDTTKGTVGFPDFNGNVWLPLTPYAVGDITFPTTYDNHYYKCTSAGTSAAAEPVAWNTAGGTTTDGSVTWTDIGLTFAGVYDVGEVVNMAQAPEPGYTFVGWTLVSGDGSINQGFWTVTPNTAAIVEVKANYSTDAIPSASTLTLGMLPVGVVSAWTASTVYEIGTVVKPTTFAGHYYKCTIAGTSAAGEPVWKTDGTDTADNTVTWADIGTQPDFVKFVPAWTATTTYAIGDFVQPTTFASHYYRCTTAGTSAGVEPAPWNTAGGTTTDGTVTWTDVGMSPFNIGDQFVINCTTIAGYDFIGWSIDAGNASVTLVGANWKAKLNSATVTINANYKAVVPDVDATMTLKSNPAAAGLPEFDIISAWTAATLYAVGDIVKPTIYGMHYYQCTVAGLSAGAEPNWPTSSGSTIADNTITWTEIGTTLPFIQGDNVAIGQNENAGYTFIGWSVTDGTAALYNSADPNNANVTINSAAVEITANYQLIHAAVNLTVAVSPTTAGQVNEFYPVVNPVPYGVAQNITATANTGYQFSHWEISGSLTIGNINNQATNVTLYADSSVTAVFIEDNATLNTVLLTIGVNPDNSGTVTNPWQGTGKAANGTGYPTSVAANAGYVFSHWELISGKCNILNPLDDTTIITPTGDATVMAVFKAEETVTLTLLTEDFNKGTVTNWTGPNVIPKDSALAITALPNAGYDFANWEVSGNIFIDSTYSPTANVTVLGDATMTAFFTQIQTCTLTLDVSPADSGMVVSPYQGIGTQNVGVQIAVDADPNPGYRFVRWKITSGYGNVLQSNPDGTGALNCFGDVTATAIFEVIEEVNLTVAVSSLEAGTTALDWTPFIGTKVVENKNWYRIDATANPEFKFANWTFTGNVLVQDQANPSTWLWVWGDGAVTANFAADPSSVLLTIGVTPAGVGFADPYMGTTNVAIGAPLLIQAAPYDTTTYTFVGWQLVSGSAIFDDASSSVTNVTPSSNTEILAVFVPRTKVNLTIAVSPVNSGTTAPWFGTESLNAGIMQNIVATAAPGYIFSHWKINSGSIEIVNASLNNTGATLTSDASITAVFVEAQPMADLTFAITPAGAGFTEPWMGTEKAEINNALPVSATANPGYRFTCWQVTSGNAKIADSLNPDTVVIPSGNATVTANFEIFGDVTLTIVVNPANSADTVLPCLGEYKVKIGTEVDVAALPGQNFEFVGWTLTTGSAAIQNAGNFVTKVKVNGDATITANFVAGVTAAITVQLSPIGACNDIWPEIGITNVPSAEWVDLIADPPVNGYIFKQWTVVSGDATVFTATSPATYVKLTTDSVVTAEFDTLTEVSLTALSDPEAAGTVTLDGVQNWNGINKIYAGVRYWIEAVPNAGFAFTNWEILAGDEAKISVENLTTQQTYVELSASATLTANFVAAETALLTVELSDESKGIIVVGLGGGLPVGVHNVPVGQWNHIVAEAKTGYEFTGWTTTGGGAFFRSQDADTYVSLTSDSTVTAEFAAADSALLTLAVSPAESGYTSPYLGVDSINANEWIQLNATPYEGYRFLNWTVTSGTATLYHPNEANAWVTLENDSVITATFEAVDTVIITAAINPSCSGNMTAGNLILGANVKESGKWHKISADPKDNTYSFVNWTTSSGDAIFENANLAETYVKATTDSLITANFLAKPTANLTLVMNPIYAGAANYFIGVTGVPTGEWIALDITDTNMGYAFTNWTVTGSAVVENPLDDTTFVMLSGDATITANFAVVPTGVLTTYDSAMKWDMQDILNVNEWTAMPYTAVNDGYIFTGWEVLSGTVEIDEPAILNTFIRIQGDAAIKANYTKATLAQITMAVNQPNPVEVSGTAQFYSTITNAWTAGDAFYAGQTVVIRANANANYKFVNWTIEGNATIANSTYDTTYAVVNGDCTLTANFAELPTAMLTMAVNKPAANIIPGTAQPASGFYRTDIPYWIQAEPAAGFRFVEWTSTGDIVIDDVATKRTFIQLSGDAVVTANFDEAITYELTVQWNPPQGAAPGTTTEDIYYVTLGENFQLAQVANPGYTFTGWTVASGTATINEVHNGGPTVDSEFSVSTTTNAVIQANFALSGTAVLTTAVLPAQELAAGTIKQYKPGNHIVPLNTNLEVTPVPNIGYVFTGWTVTGGAQVYTKPTEVDANPETHKDDTLYYVSLTAAGTLTANFAVATTVDLIVETDLFAGGTIAGNYGINNIGTYSLRTGEKIWIWVSSVNPGYAFTGWTITGAGNVVKEANAQINEQLTYITLASAGTLTANFVALEQVPVTFTVDPKGAGVVSFGDGPAAGAYMLTANNTYWISATANSGYSFVQWTIEGGVTVNDITSMLTTAIFTADAKVTAEFAPVSTVEMELSANPSDNAGDILCANGALTFNSYGVYTVQTGTWWSILAVENVGFKFVRWETSANVIIMDPNISGTKIYPTGDCGITAVYEELGTAELTIAISPENTADTRPGEPAINFILVEPGIHTIPSNQWVDISADTNFGWKFVKWTKTGDLELLRYENHRTQVYMAPDAVGSVTAVFEPVETVVMTMTYNDLMGSETNYGLGEFNVPKNEWIPVSALAKKGYRFVQWNIDANSQIAGNRINDENASIRLSADSVVQAQFEAATQVEVTLGVNPVYAGGGVTGGIELNYGNGVESYGVGRWTIDAGKKFILQATSIVGFKFVKWSYTGGVVVTNTFEGSSYVTVTADGTITAEFVAVPTCELTMAASPEQGLGSFMTDIPFKLGTVANPGTYTVSVGQVYSVFVSAYETYRFVNWTTTGDITVRMLKTMEGCTYEITLAGDATLTANFEKNTYAQLTLAVTPPEGTEQITAGNFNGGFVNGVGTHTVYSAQWLKAEVMPAVGYKFVNWTTTDATKIEIEDPYNRATDFYLFGDADLTANFVAATTAVLTVVYNDPKGGEANLAQGTHNVTVGDWIMISADAFDGFYFSGWTVTAGGKIYMNRCNDEETFVMLAEAATLTANFAVAAPANLTLASTPTIGGKAEFWTYQGQNIGHGTYAVDSNKKYDLGATPYMGYKFSKWTVSDATKATVGDANAETTYFILTADATITAEFVAIPTAQITLTADPVQALYYTSYYMPVAATKGYPQEESYGGFGLSKDYVSCVDPEWCWFHPGTYPLESSKTYLLQVIATESYRLKEWLVTDSQGNPTTNATVTEVTNYYNWNHLAESYSSGVWYYLTVNGDATVKAVFEKRPTAMLTVQIDPAASGKLGMSLNSSEFWDLDPAPVEIYTGILYDVTAFAAEGFYFQGLIVVEGNAQVVYGFDEDCFSRAKVSILTDATIRAVFDVTPPDIPYLTMAINNANAGTINPLAGTYPSHLGQQYSISATANAGYVFLYWQADIPANVIIGNVNSASTTVAVIDDVTVTAVFTTAPVVDMTIMSFSSGLDSTSVGSLKPKDNLSLYARLDNRELDFTNGLKLGVDGWFVEVTTWTKPDPAKGTYYYENAEKTIKITIKKDKDGNWTVKASSSKSALYELIDPTNAIDVFLIVGELKYVATFDPDDSTKWSFKPADKTAAIQGYSATYNKKNGIVSQKDKTSVTGQNFAKPAGFDNTVRPIVMIDSATWNVDVVPESKDADTYLYKSDKALSPFKYELSLKFPVGNEKFSFKSDSGKTGSLSRKFVELPTVPVTWAIVNTLTFDFGATVGQYSWRIEKVNVKTKLNYKRK